MSKEDIVKLIQSIQGNVYTVYSDWVKLCAITIQNAVMKNETREQEYMHIISRYKEQDVTKFVEAFGILQMLIEEKYEDYLGSMYMMLENGSKRTGQFFTPYHISELVAELAAETEESNGRKIINEPSCGGGANIIAFLAKKKRENVNFQQEYEIIAQDLDWNCVYMCYVQLSLMGAYARVIQGDTLSNSRKDDHVLYTPMYLLSRGGCSGR